MRGIKGSSPRYSGRREPDSDRPGVGDSESLDYEDDNDLPDLIMDIDDDVLDDPDFDDFESQEESVGYKNKSRSIFMFLSLLGLVACIVLLSLVAYFASTYVGTAENLQTARDSLQNTTESYLKLRQQVKLREEMHCTQFRNSTEHWLHLFCEKYECPSRICDPGWLLHSKNCYYFSNTSLSWEQSKAMCFNRQGQLAVIGSDRVQYFIVEQAKDAPYWIGLTDKVTEGNWAWVDGTKVTDGATFWALGQPDNAFNRTLRSTENCGLLYQRRWYDEACMRKFPTICEKNAIRLHLIFQRLRRRR